jgi:hypothetical protein
LENTGIMFQISAIALYFHVVSNSFIKQPWVWGYGVWDNVGVSREQTNAYISLQDEGTGQCLCYFNLFKVIGFVTDSIWLAFHDLAFQLKWAVLEEQGVVFVNWCCAMLTGIIIVSSKTYFCLIKSSSYWYICSCCSSLPLVFCFKMFLNFGKIWSEKLKQFYFVPDNLYS